MVGSRKIGKTLSAQWGEYLGPVNEKKTNA